MFANKALRDMFMHQHPELFDPDYWLELHGYPESAEA